MAITFAYTESTNIVVVTEGTSGTPATCTDFVTADRAGTDTVLLSAGSPASDLALTYAVRPVEDLAVLVKCVVANKTAEADFIFITGTDWHGAAQTESIDVTVGDQSYTSTKYWASITTLDCSDNANGGGTVWADGDLTVTQDVWGVIWDYGGKIYRLDCRLYIGDDSTTTHFADTNAVIIVSDGATPASWSEIFRIKSEATATFGALGDATAKTAKDGVSIEWENTSYMGCYLFYLSGGTLYCYDTKIKGSYAYANRSSAFKLSSGSIPRIWGCQLTGDINLENLDSGTDIYNLNITGSDADSVFTDSVATMDRIFLSEVKTPFRTNNTVSMTISNSIVKRLTTGLISSLNYSGTSNLIDVDSTDWEVVWYGTPTTGQFNRKNTVNIHVADKDGNNLSGVSVLCEDADGNTTGGFSAVTTAADGTITEQTIFRGYCDKNNSNLDTDLTKDYSPHKFTLSKSGYETLVLDNITVDGAIDWHLELQDMNPRKHGRREMG